MKKRPVNGTVVMLTREATERFPALAEEHGMLWVVRKRGIRRTVYECKSIVTGQKELIHETYFIVGAS